MRVIACVGLAVVAMVTGAVLGEGTGGERRGSAGREAECTSWCTGRGTASRATAPTETAFQADAALAGWQADPGQSAG